MEDGLDCRYALRVFTEGISRIHVAVNAGE